MVDLRNQKRMASEVLDVGENRVWFDPDRLEDIANAISRQDIRELIEEGAIQARQKKGVSRGRARVRNSKRKYGHGKGHGKRKGKAGAREARKENWMKRIRAQRKQLREMRAEGEIDSSAYRLLYRKAKGGEFRSVAHMKTYIEAHGLMEE